MARRATCWFPIVILTLVLLASSVEAAAPPAELDPADTGAGRPMPAHVVTFTMTSQFVDPTKIVLNPPPPGVPPRPNALRVNVYLPDGYNGERRFPVLYLLGGAGSSYDSWVVEGDLLDLVHGFPAIIVMPEGGRSWHADWWNGGQRANPAWESFYVKELIPFVEEHFRILHGRHWHAVAGVSMGGEGAIYLASQRPDYFGAAASFSGALSIQQPLWHHIVNPIYFQPDLVFGPDQSSFYWTGHNPTALVANLKNTRVFVSCGDGVPRTPAEQADDWFTEYITALQQPDFVTAARAEGVDITFQPHPGIHTWPYFRQELADAIQWGFFAEVPMHPTRWAFTTVAQHSNAWGYEFEFAAPPDGLETFTFDHDVLTGTGSGQLTVQTPNGHIFTATMPFAHKKQAA